jgi:hypothetical protein
MASDSQCPASAGLFINPRAGHLPGDLRDFTVVLFEDGKNRPNNGQLAGPQKSTIDEGRLTDFLLAIRQS